MIISILRCSKYDAQTEPISKELKLLKLEDTFKIQELKLYYKYKNNKFLHYLQNVPFEPNKAPMIMQHAFNITDTKSRLTMFMQNIVHIVVPTLWIVLQNLYWIQLIHSLQCFDGCIHNSHITVISRNMYSSKPLYLWNTLPNNLTTYHHLFAFFYLLKFTLICRSRKYAMYT